MAFADNPWRGIPHVEAWLDNSAEAVVSQIQYDRDSNYDTDSKINLVIGVVTPDWTDFKGYGVVENGASSPTASMIYPLASVTKTMTGVILAKQIENDEYSINDSIKYILRTSCYKNWVGWRTLKQLAAHSAAYKTMPNNYDGTYTGRELCSCLRASYCSWNRQTPGVQVNYSNLGLGLLAITLIEGDRNISGLADLYETELTGPSELNMQDTMLVRDYTRSDPYMTQGYDQNGEPQAAATMGVLGGAGEMAASGNDMITFLQMLTVQRAYRSDWLSVMQRACTNIAPPDSGHTLGYGFRITNKYYDNVNIGHYAYDKTGSTGQHTAYIFWAPNVNSKIGIFAAINTAGPARVNGVNKTVINHVQVLVQDLYKRIYESRRTRG
jgi:CubicO group peptidase (beta-lactamase class C family)